MDDRVGDVLAQRAALRGGAGAAVVLSLLLHGGLSALMAWAALHAAQTLTPRTLQIRLSPAAAARVSEVTPAAPAAKPAAPPAPPKAQLERPIVEPPKKPLPPPEKNTVPLSPFGKSTKKGSENAAPNVPPPPPAAVPGLTTGAAVPVGGAGVTGLEGGDFPYTLYIDRMKTLIGGRWYRPQLAAGPTTTIHFTIERDGAIRDAAIETASGNGTFDRAALRAVLESSPLPPLPFGYTGTYLGVHLTFR